MDNKVVNPISKKRINIDGKVFNDLLNAGYVFKNNQLIYQPQESEEDESEEEFEEESEETEDESEEEEIEEEIYEYNEKRPFFEKRDIDIPYYEMPSVRCMVCNKPIASLHKKYVELRGQGMAPLEIYEELGLKRNCCRMGLTQSPKYHLSEIDELNEEMNDLKISKLSKNPYLSKREKTGPEVIRLYEGDQFLGLKKKVTFGKNDEYVKYDTFTSPEVLKRKNIGSGKYYISYSK